MKVLEAIKTLLRDHGISFELLEHEATPTSEDSARVRGDRLSMGAKAIVYKVQDTFGLFVFAADRQLDPKLIKTHFKAQGIRVKKTRFATGEELINLTGLVPGSVPPFGRPVLDLDLFVDPSLTSNEEISFNAGSLTTSIRLKLEDYLSAAKPEIFSFTKTKLAN